jgi:hypothetical protein
LAWKKTPCRWRGIRLGRITSRNVGQARSRPLSLTPRPTRLTFPSLRPRSGRSACVRGPTQGAYGRRRRQ